MNAVIYARYSSEGERATSIEDQERNCRKRIDASGWKLVQVFADEAMSGALTARPGYQAMLSAATARQFDVLVIDDLSRFARDSVEQERAIRRLEFQGIRIIATSDGYDSESKGHKVHRGFKGLMNEMFLDDLAEKVHRDQTGQALKGRWNGGRPYGYKLAAIRDTSQRDAYGQHLQIGTALEIDPDQAEVVREIFQRRADGESCLTIARELNSRGVPSPGSTWRRKVRRCSGWMASAIRVIIQNPLYIGTQRWNTSRFVRDPDSKKHLRRARPESEWISNELPDLRIVTLEIFQRAQQRGRSAQNGDARLKSGGKPRFLLSGLLVCQKCESHYVMANERSYQCSGYAHGRACDNGIRIRRDAVEANILRPIRDELLAPGSVDGMAGDLEKAFAAQIAERVRRIAEQPKDVRELEARIDRLRARLHAGDPDMPEDELRTAIDRADEKLRVARESAPESRQSARLVALLPKAAENIRREIDLALMGDSRSAMKARLLIRDMIGTIELEPDADGGLWANFLARPAALLRAGGSDGRGERI